MSATLMMVVGCSSIQVDSMTECALDIDKFAGWEFNSSLNCTDQQFREKLAPTVFENIDERFLIDDDEEEETE